MSGGAGQLQEVFHQVDRIVQEIGVIRADIDVELAPQFRASWPIALQYRVQIVMFAPIFGGGVIDHSSPFVEDRLRIAVLCSGRIDRLPDVELLAGTYDRLTQLHTRHCHASRSACGPDSRAYRVARPSCLLLKVKQIVLFIQVSRHEGAEIDRVG